jgi:hypothetical protein
MAATEERTDHVDEFFARQILVGLADDYILVADALMAALDESETPTLDRMRQLHRRLVWTFDAELLTFERKRYASLSHEANKAMNLNSYIALMGRRWRERQGARPPANPRLWAGGRPDRPPHRLPD